MSPARLVAAALALALVFGAAGGGASRAGPDPEHLYVRDVRTFERAVEILAERAKQAKTPEVLVAFDQITFTPPPGRSEYAYDHDYAGDVDAWIEALAGWSRRDGAPRIRAVATLAAKPVALSEVGWPEALRRQLEERWWEAPGRRFEPALEWIRRWMPRGGTRSKPVRLVLVANEMTPERWAESAGGGSESWRSRLLRVGTYWDVEAIDKALKRAHGILDVVGPEVRFGDETPLPTLPELPWASRPQRAPPDLYGSLGADPEKAYDQMLRNDLERDLAEEFPDPAERKRQIDELLGTGDEETRSVPADAEDEKNEDAPSPGDGRFTAGTPSLFPRWGETVLFANDVPSGFGYWPYAHAAHRSGGRYVFYPYGPSRWLDVCPRDARRLARLAPSLEARGAALRRRTGDRALHAMCRAVARVIDVTPWFDRQGSRSQGAWSAFVSASPLRGAQPFRLRRRPWNPFLMGRAAALRGVGTGLRRVVGRYDEAIAILDDALERAAPGKPGWPERSVADLRLSRFLFSMSAFHLAGLSLCLREIDRYLPEHFNRRSDDVILTELLAIRLSDCLDAYDELKILPGGESHYPRAVYRAWTPARGASGPVWWEPGTEVPGQQGNVLLISPVVPEYRARREADAVLKHIDRRLKKRATDMIESARVVMEHYAKTPWGWTVYYSEAKCFVFDPVDWGLDVRPRGGDDAEDSKPPWSPTRPGGSTPGGPTTR